jgi:tripartite-type tricarboxylate transporter receptor subunit TctC
MMGTKAFALSAIAAVSLAVTVSHPANAQSYPERLIKIVVPFPAGGPSDVAARLVTQPLSSKLGQSVIIENLPGAGGRTGAKAVAQASPDGYTLLLGGTNPNAIAQSLYRNLNFEPLKDFTAVALIGLDSNALVVNPSVPAKTLQELVQYAKANPGKLTSGSTVGIGPHICLELFRARTGTDIAFIPYKGAAPAIADLLGGQIQIGMTSKAVLLPLIREGRLRALAVTSEVRWPELPDVPTMGESGLDRFPAYLRSGLLAPARTPEAIIDKLNGAIVEGLRAPEMQASIAKLGFETRSLTAREFGAKLDEEAHSWEAAVNESGVKLDYAGAGPEASRLSPGLNGSTPSCGRALTVPHDVRRFRRRSSAARPAAEASSRVKKYSALVSPQSGSSLRVMTYV